MLFGNIAATKITLYFCLLHAFYIEKARFAISLHSLASSLHAIRDFEAIF